ncbi:MAG: hypothetical protein U5K79_25755 [Cyclobacteriaceae bacterium]|nr:hypothetical protein [Cyclobacteriaceae bacterium]
MQEKYEAEKRNNQILLQQAEIKQKSMINYFLLTGIPDASIVKSSSPTANYPAQTTACKINASINWKQKKIDALPR